MTPTLFDRPTIFLVAWTDSQGLSHTRQVPSQEAAIETTLMLRGREDVTMAGWREIDPFEGDTGSGAEGF